MIYVLATFQLISLVFILILLYALSKRVNAVEIQIIREVMEANPQEVDKILETAKRLKDLGGSDVFGYTSQGAMKAARKLHGLS